jgi:LmbE family N-acetylglucosaminyl deacetylase
VYSSEEIARIRDGEAGRAAAVAGAQHATLGFSDGEVLASDPEQRRAVVDLVRETRPELIITHYPADYMSDHNEISKLVFDASFHATLPLFETGKPNYDLVAPIYYMDTLMGIGFQPAEYVDLAPRPRPGRHRRADEDSHPISRPAVRRRVRGGLRALPRLASPKASSPATLTGGGRG